MMSRWGSVLIAAGLLVAAVPFLRPSSAVAPAAIVREGPFEELLAESGAIAAANQVTYGAPLGATTWKILEIAPEGARVQAGDVLIRFDTSALEAERVREASAHQAAETERVRASEEAWMEQLRADSDAQSARERLTLAEQALANEVEGQGQVEIAETAGAADEARREAARLRKAYDDLKPLLAEGFMTRAEMEKAEQTATRAESAAALAALRAKAVREFQHPAAIAKSRVEVGTAREAFGHLAGVSRSRLAQARAALALAETHVSEARSRVAAVEAGIAAAVVRAQASGIVMYRDGYFGAERRKPLVGDQVAVNQPLLAVPDPSRLVTEIRVREVDVRKIAVGEKVHVRPDAFPDLDASGAVVSIGALALEDPLRVGARFFPVTVSLDRADSRLVPGLTVRVELPTISLPRVLIVPAAAVAETPDGTAYCVVAGRGSPTHRNVTVLAETEKEAAIRGPIAVGERVLLVDPSARR